jgi:hypothetical protein
MRKFLLVIVCAAVAVSLLSPSAASADERSTFDLMAEHYEAIRVALLHDHTDGVGEHARAIVTAARLLSVKFDPAYAGVEENSTADCLALLPEIAKTATEVGSARDIGSVRAAFGELTKPMVRYREMASGDRPVVVFCSMEKKAWLQPEGEIGNPYLGQSMAKCGDIVSQ